MRFLDAEASPRPFTMADARAGARYVCGDSGAVHQIVNLDSGFFCIAEQAISERGRPIERVTLRGAVHVGEQPSVPKSGDFVTADDDDRWLVLDSYEDRRTVRRLINIRTGIQNKVDLDDTFVILGRMVDDEF